MKVLPEKLKIPKGLALALILTAVAYIPAIGSYFHEDDWGHLLSVAARHINPWGFSGWFYRPLFLAAAGGMYKIFGLNVPLWHIITILVHMASVALVYYLVRRIKLGKVAAAAGAILFGIYPTNPDAVTWISAFSGVMAAFWGLVAVHISLNRRIPVFIRGLLCATAFALAVFSKEDSAALVLVIPFLPVLVDEKRDRRETFKWFLSCILLVLVIAGIQHLESCCHVALGNPHGRFNLSIFRRSAMFVAWESRMLPLGMTSTLWQVGLLAVMPILLWKRWPGIRPGVLWFFGTSIGIGTAIGTLAPADRYGYIPSIGIALCFAALVDRLSLRKKPLSFDQWVILVTSAVILGNINASLIDKIATAALLFCFWSDSTSTKVTRSVSIAIVAASSIFTIVSYPLRSFGLGYYPDWLVSTLPFALTALLVGYRALRRQELHLSETLLLGCLVFWCALKNYEWFLAGLVVIEVLRSHLTTRIKLHAGVVKALSRLSSYRTVLVPSIVLIVCLYSTLSINMYWLHKGREVQSVVQQSVRIYKQLPKGASVEVIDKACLGSPEPRIHNSMAEVIAERPDLKLTIKRLLPTDKLQASSCDFRLTYYPNKAPVLTDMRR